MGDETMKIDLYTKAVLTVIAAALVIIAARDVGFVRKANAYGTGQDVRVTNYETDRKTGETLFVYCTNCQE